MLALATAATGAYAQAPDPLYSLYAGKDDRPGAYDCVVKPSIEVDLSSPIAGVIDVVRVQRGSVVKKGDVVAELTAEVERANLALATLRAESEEKIAAARLKIEFLKRRVARNEKLNSSKIVSDDIVDEIRTDLEVAQKDLESAVNDKAVAELEREQARTVLAQKVIRSTVDGVVTKVSREAGEFTSEQTPIATIASIDPLFVEAYLPVRLHGAVRAGMVAEIVTEAPANGRFQAELSIVDRVYDAASGTFGVRLVLANGDLAIPAGTRCTLEFLQN